MAALENMRHKRQLGSYDLDILIDNLVLTHGDHNEVIKALVRQLFARLDIQQQRLFELAMKVDQLTALFATSADEVAGWNALPAHERELLIKDAMKAAKG